MTRAFIKTAFLALLGLGANCLAQAGDGQDIGAVLNKRYVHENLFLRQALEENAQVYDSDGNLKSPGHEGPWTLLAGLNVNAINISAQEIRIAGDRLSFEFKDRQKGLEAVKAKKPIQVAVELRGPLASLDQAEAILRRVFAMTDGDVVESVPRFWKYYLTRTSLLKPGRKPTKMISDLLPKRTETLVRIGIDRGVNPPQPIHTPEPAGSEPPQKGTYQGLVILSAIIDETGKVVDPWIMQPLGKGLDEKAVEIMEKWRFKPAQQHGHPVKVEMALEIQFNLY
jgi:TonB family protein